MSESPLKEYVVVLHGIARTWRSMRTLSRFLRRSGYEVLNVGYPSNRQSLEALVDHIYENINPVYKETHRKVNFVGYSLGGLLARAVIHKYRPTNLGRVVQLAPPNQGSEVADFWRNFFLFRWIFGQAGQDLGSKEKQFSRILGPVDFELGMIAGNCSWDPISSMMISGPDDGKVSVASTRVEGLADHVTIPATHTFIIYNREAFNQTLHFLRHGCFERSIRE